MIEPGTEVPDAELIDQDGRTRRLSDWRGKTIAVTFVYTRCPLPDFCPLMDRHFAAAQEALAVGRGARDRACTCCRSASIPITTRRRSLAAHASARRRRSGDLVVSHGSAEAVDRSPAAFGVSDHARRPADAGDHAQPADRGDRPDGRLVTVLNGRDWTPEELLSALRAADARR